MNESGKRGKKKLLTVRTSNQKTRLPRCLSAAWPLPFFAPLLNVQFNKDHWLLLLSLHTLPLESRNGPSGFSGSSTAEEVTRGIDASGLTAIVTGASSGLGSETTRVLALRGVHVIMGVRNMAAGRDVRDAIVKEIPAAKVDFMELDLSSLASVRKFASDFNSSGRPLNLLINNAGIMATPFMLSKDNIELQFATNHLGHFLLTSLLLDTMKKTARESDIEGRIVNVSSEFHRYPYPERIRFDKLNDQSGYKRFLAYGQSKLANVLHTNELTRRFKEDGINITANSLHPGIIATNLFRHNVSLANDNPIRAFLKSLARLVLKNVEQGAATTCYVALNPQVKGASGEYFSGCNLAAASSESRDAELAKKLWDFRSSGFSSSSTAEKVTHGINASGLTAIVTGASSGLGSETTRVLALRGVHVIMGVRNMAAGRDVRDAIVKEIPAAKVDFMELDLSSLASVRKFASDFNSSGRPLNLLINNAGIMATPFMLSKDNIELQFSTNHLGHFLLTSLLLDTMKKTARESDIEGRIVNVSSESHRSPYPEGIRFDKINDQSGYKKFLAYGQSKLANVLHANELTRRFKEDGIHITANSLHPGLIATNLFRHNMILANDNPIRARLVLKNVQQGAATTCYVALNPQVKGASGEYFSGCNLAAASSESRDAELAKKLWDFRASGFSASSTAEDVTEGIDGSGLTAIVTGASSGIGAETARVLALRGVHVVMGVRNLEAGREVKEAIVKGNPNAKVDAIDLDLSSMASVKKFAEDFKSLNLPLNLLMNHGNTIHALQGQHRTSIRNKPFGKTASASRKEGRIVNVSSRRHQFSYQEGIRFAKLSDPSGYNSLSAYGQSKLANILHANEIARQLKEDRVDVTANSVHPGLIATNLFRHYSFVTGLVGLVGKFVIKNVQQGAATTCYVALHPEVKGMSGQYVADSNIAKASLQANDAELAKKLWDFSSDLVRRGTNLS
ncbi:hypothetical protein SADUNF_Sadunf12G0112600 [Salix dunnii]|uniref:Short-chain dehydrogenase TIC 32, chloroplastic n=1 Tax=Salix dunnii TaxID=1413687 RepID=A0A835MSN7_9ROSI|nr:hypothetical protein SADUNF_Sadunf12G0112600 [Salix dunnii]